MGDGGLYRCLCREEHLFSPGHPQEDLLGLGTGERASPALVSSFTGLSSQAEDYCPGSPSSHLNCVLNGCHLREVTGWDRP